MKKEISENDIFSANILDKVKIAKTRNQIIATDFLDMYKRKIAQDILNVHKEKNYEFYVPYEELEKAILIVFPEKYKEIMDSKKFDYSTLIKVIRITLPSQLKGKYLHKDYLSAIMKLGVKREKVGDIIVFEDGADIEVKPEICEYILQNLKLLTRFSKATIEEVHLRGLRKPEIKTKEIRITVSSLRCDNIISEILKCSRNEASNIIEDQRVFVNYSLQEENSKNIKVNDVIVIRGKGKFKVKEDQGKTKKEKTVLIVEHYV